MSAAISRMTSPGAADSGEEECMVGREKEKGGVRESMVEVHVQNGPRKTCGHGPTGTGGQSNSTLISLSYLPISLDFARIHT